MRAESPGPSVEKLVPRIKTSSKMLYTIYLGMTLIMFILLLLGKMPLFDTITLTLASAGTGGFSIKNSGLADYSYYQQSVITIFMFLFGINFNFYYLIILRKFKSAFKMEEVRWYFIIFITAIILISFNIGEDQKVFLFATPSAFHVSSIITTTGYTTLDFNYWPTFSKSVLILLMFIGACAGSTSGGIKVSRIVIAFKSIGKELSYLLHRRSVKILKFEGRRYKMKQCVQSIPILLPMLLSLQLPS